MSCRLAQHQIKTKKATTFFEQIDMVGSKLFSDWNINSPDDWACWDLEEKYRNSSPLDGQTPSLSRKRKVSNSIPHSTPKKQKMTHTTSPESFPDVSLILEMFEHNQRTSVEVSQLLGRYQFMFNRYFL